MNEKFHRISRGELRKFARAADLSASPSLMPANFWHIYIKLEFKKQYENADTKSDGKSFVRNVMRASAAVEEVVTSADGIVVEVQGSVIHCLLPDDTCNSTDVRTQCHSINNALHLIFNDASRVEGWRMATDWGKTLLVSGRGIHDDNSYVSLGNSANAPAKYLFAQLARGSEEARSLKRFMLAWRATSSSNWIHEHLGTQVNEEFRKVASATFAEIRGKDFGVTSVLTKQARAAQDVRAQAAPVDSTGSTNGLSNGEPVVYFGWIMRADLDGFTARVEKCFDDDLELLRLGERFQKIMDEAAEFADGHDEILVQLPWAGDNFTAAVVFSEKDKYEDAIEEKLVQFSLDFSDALDDVAASAGLSGWAQSIAGGNLHGNSVGNIYIGAVEFEGRRFLIGTGQGMGRSTQGFSDMNPGPGQLAVFEDDYALLLKPYQEQLIDREKSDGSQSTLFRKGNVDNLKSARQKIRAALESVREPAKTLVTIGTSAKVLASSRDYCET